MERSFKEYIANPLGNKTAVFSSREMYRNLYTDKFNILMVGFVVIIAWITTPIMSV